MRATASIAINVFRESVRDKVLYNLVLFAILLIGASYLIGQLTAGQDVKIIKDLGLAATSIFGLFIAVFIGIGLVSKEVERRSIYSLLSKPIHRYQVIAGKYAGPRADARSSTSRSWPRHCTPCWLYMSWSVPADVQSGRGTRPRWIRGCSKAVALILVELMIVTAIALFFSTFSTPMLSAAFTFGLFIAGHFSADLRNFEPGRRFARGRQAGARAVLGAAEPRTVRRQGAGRACAAGAARVHAADRPPTPALYIAVLLVAAMAIFSRRDFK